MEPHYQLTDAEFESQFRDTSLNPAHFTHDAHLRLAWIHISKYGLEAAINNLCRQIKAYAESLGDGDRFNKTVTVAAVKAIYHFMNKSRGNSFVQLIEEFPRLKLNFKDLMCAHYSFEVFTSTKAKKEYLAPDLLPFD